MVCSLAALKSPPVHSFNALIIPIPRDSLQSLSYIDGGMWDVIVLIPSWPFCLLCISELLLLCCVAALNSLQVHRVY